jgi:PAS domain S-box-containing protein
VSMLLLILATVIAAGNAIQSRHAIRLFWSFLAVACGLWAIIPVFWLLYEAGFAQRFSQFWLSTCLLFLHIILLIAAVASRPHLKLASHKPYRTTLNFFLLLLFLVFVFAFFLVPYQSMQWDSAAILRFGNWYFAENLLLLGVIVTVLVRARQPWKSIYWHLLGASSLYALTSLLLNIIVARLGPVDQSLGSSTSRDTALYSVLYSAVACWFVWVVLRGRKLAPELEQTVQLDTSDPKYTFPLVMLAVLAIPLAGIWDLFRVDEPYSTRMVRVFVVLITFLLLVAFVFIREHLAGRELAADAGSAHDRLRLAMESAKSVGWDWDVKSGKDFWFGDLQTMFGIPSDSYSGHVEDFRRRVHPDDRGQVWKAVHEAMQTRGPYVAEFRVVREDGTVRWIAARGKFSYSANGEAERMLGMATDITETKRAEVAVRESEDKLSLLLESTAEGIYGIDLEGRCTFCNPACLQRLGYERAEELLGQNMHSLIHHSHADGTPYPEEECLIQRACHTGEGIHLEDESLWRRDGTSFPAEYWAYPQRKDEKVVGAVVAFIDITDRKRAQQALRQSEALKASILSSLENHIAVLDKSGVIIEVNVAWTRFAHENGMTAEAAGVGADYLGALARSAPAHPEALEVLACIHTVMAGKVRRCRYDYQCSWLSPRRWFAVTTTPLQTAEGGVVVSYKEVSDVRRRDEELAEAQRLAKVGSWQWDPKTDIVTWSEELYRITGIDPNLPAVSFREHSKLYTAESWERLSRAVEEALRTATPYELDLEMVRSDGAARWLVARGEALRDAAGHVVRLRGTVQDISDRKRAEQALRESEERFRLVSDTAPVMIWTTGADKLCTYVNKTWLDFTGNSMESQLGNGWVESIHPQDRTRSMQTYLLAFDRREACNMEYRVRRFDGQYRWVQDSGVPRFNADGSFAGYIGSCIDVTERKMAEEALSSVGRRLIAAHEEERAWIARELHDDIGQRLALLSIELESLQVAPSQNPRELPGRIRQILKQTSEIANEIQAISHRLHSSKLEYLGLVAAAKGFCTELSEQQKIKIDFRHDAIPRALPPEVEMCLFRVLQEALRNAVKHSHVQQVKVELRAGSNDLCLSVRDSGVGFDPSAALLGKGLGLVSMQERLRLVNGELIVQSAPDGGTAIQARVPLPRGEALAG